MCDYTYEVECNAWHDHSKLVHRIQELWLDDSVIQWSVIDMTCSVQCCRCCNLYISWLNKSWQSNKNKFVLSWFFFVCARSFLWNVSKTVMEVDKATAQFSLTGGILSNQYQTAYTEIKKTNIKIIFILLESSVQYLFLSLILNLLWNILICLKTW